MGSALPKGGPAGLFIAFAIWGGVSKSPPFVWGVEVSDH